MTAAFVCALCGLRSHHPRDAAERFCAVCGFVDDVLAERRLAAERAAGRDRTGDRPASPQPAD